MPQHVIIIGAGFSGLSAASFLAKAGFEVTVYEKNSQPGGRAGQIKEAGFTFDLGPSWYWMPDIYDRFFNQFGKSTSDFYSLLRLDPGYRVFFNKDEYIEIPSNYDELLNTFEILERGSSEKLKKFIKESEEKYFIGVHKAAYKPSKSIFEFLEKEIVLGIFKLDIFKSLSRLIRKEFKNPKLISILEFPVIFLGASPDRIPALYSLMNYADLKLGSWYPEGGFFSVASSLEKLCTSLGVKIYYNSPAKRIIIEKNRTTGIELNNTSVYSDYIIASCDYRHTEIQLIEKQYRNYTEKYWDSRLLAPSAIIFYIGISKKVNKLLHHNLFFDEDFSKHSDDIYKSSRWPEKPCLYVSCSSKTDLSVAPNGYENLVILIPVAPGLKESKQIVETYFNYSLNKIERFTDQSILNNIVLHKEFTNQDFTFYFNSYKGNAYGLANTLLQTAILKPRIQNNKIKNLFYAGQLTIPGPGVPPALISGEIVAKEIIKSGRK